MTRPEKLEGMFVGRVFERDTAGLARVKVKFPLEKDRESNWCRIAMPFAGKKKDGSGESHGFQWIPNVGDEVIVAHYGNNADEPVVLGSVYSEDRPPPTAAADERWIQSSRGDRFGMSEVKGEEEVLLATPEGQELRITKKGKVIVLANEHVITLDSDKGQLTIKSAGGLEMSFNDKREEVTVSAPKVIINAASVKMVKS